MAAGLSWLLHSACHVLYPKVDSNKVSNPSNNIEDVDGGHHGVKGLKKVVSNSNSTCAELFSSSADGSSGFQMPLHYPRYKKMDYETMEEWKVDLLLKQYGLAFEGTPDQKRAFAMGAFLWPDQY